MSKHTPGPWEWVGASNLHGGPSPDSVIFCTAEYDDGYYGVLHCEEADRKLIAAAPNLLDFCTVFTKIDVLDINADLIPQLMIELQAIAKVAILEAEGEGQ